MPAAVTDALALQRARMHATAVIEADRVDDDPVEDPDREDDDR
jgi:hypothetical protein